MEDIGYLRSRMSFDAATGLFHWLPLAENLAWSRRYGGRVVGSSDKDGYRVVVILILGKKAGIKLHRLAWAFHFGEVPYGEIDHINHDRADNRPENLRVVMRADNTRNISGNSRNTSGYMGVSKSNVLGMWRARFRHNGKEVVVGNFPTPERANEALIVARAACGYHENHGESR